MRGWNGGMNCCKGIGNPRELIIQAARATMGAAVEALLSQVI
jgi:hypothetical protein